MYSGGFHSFICPTLTEPTKISSNDSNGLTVCQLPDVFIFRHSLRALLEGCGLDTDMQRKAKQDEVYTLGCRAENLACGRGAGG